MLGDNGQINPTDCMVVQNDPVALDRCDCTDVTSGAMIAPAMAFLTEDPGAGADVLEAAVDAASDAVGSVADATQTDKDVKEPVVDSASDADRPQADASQTNKDLKEEAEVDASSEAFGSVADATSAFGSIAVPADVDPPKIVSADASSAFGSIAAAIAPPTLAPTLKTPSAGM
jgi:hypothetical protein